MSKEHLRESILLTAQRAFDEKGIRSVTMDEIAALLGISKRTLYEQYPNKETVLMECIRRGQQEIRQAFQQIMRTSANVIEMMIRTYLYSLEHLHRVNPLFFTDIHKYPKAYLLFCNKQHKDTSEVLQFIRRGVEEGYFLDNLNFQILDALMQSSLDQIGRSSQFSDFQFSEVCRNLLLVFVRGICTEKGVHLFDQMMAEYLTEPD